MKVVLEGPDNAGKTTLATFLREHTVGVIYNHPGGKPDSPAAEEDCMSAQYQMASILHRCLLDRVTCISQQVYNPDPERDWDRQQAAATLLQVPNLVVVYCRPPNEVLMDVGNFKWRQEETEEHRQKIISRQHEFVERYDTVMQRVPCLHYNWRDDAHANVLRTKLLQALGGRGDAITWFKDVIAYGSGQ